MSGFTALVVGLPPEKEAALGAFLTQQGVVMTTAPLDPDAFRVYVTSRFHTVVVNFCDDGPAAALLIESVTLISPSQSVVAVQPDDPGSLDSTVSLALTKAKVRVPIKLDAVDMENVVHACEN